MARQKSFSTILVIDALAKMHFEEVTNQDIRRLAVFAKDIATDTAMVKKLRAIINQYRLNPCEVLEMVGVGIMTLITVDKLSKHLKAHEVKAEFGVGDNLDATITILRTFGRGTSAEVRKLVDDARLTLTKARVMLENEKLEQGLKEAISPARRMPKKPSIGKQTKKQ